MPMPDIQFTLTNDFIELYKLLKVCNLFESGGAAKFAIANSKIRVDGQIETRKACKIRRGQQVLFDSYVINVI